MSKLHDIKESKVWQEAHQLGKEKGRELVNRGHVKRLLAKGNSLKEIAKILAIPLADVRRFARSK